jgi:restriction system protein
MSNQPKKKTEGARFVEYFGPLLDALRKLGGSGSPDEVVEQMASDLSLSDEAQNELLPSGEPRFRDQVRRARFNLAKEGLIDASKRGIWSLTERGRSKVLSLEESLKIYQKQRHNKETDETERLPDPLDKDLSADHPQRLIDLLLTLPPSGFERLCQRILREAGFTQVNVTGRSGDEGIDGHGILQINELVSLKVIFQCKRYRSSVSPAHVRDFRGTMSGRADKGIIITTGTFAAEARREASRDGVPQIELVDGEKLVELLERLELGLKPVKKFEIDEKFFSEFREP